MSVGRVKVAAGAAGLVLMLACGAAILILNDYRHALAEARVIAANLTATLAAHADGVFVAADRVLTGATEQVQADGITSDAEFRRVMSTYTIHDRLLASIRGVPQIDIIGIASADGALINVSQHFPAPISSVADRDFFIAAIQPGFAGVTLGRPIRSRVDNSWIFTLARQVTAPDGRVLGIVMVGLSVDFFQNFYRAINIGPGNAISLFRRDGVLLARAPARDELLGTSFSDQPVFRDGLERGRTEATLEVAEPRLADSNAASRRIVAFKALDRFPLVVNTTLTSDLYLSAWRQTAAGILIGLLVICAAVAMLGLILARLLGWLHGTLDALDDGIMLITRDRQVPLINRRALELLGLPDIVARTTHRYAQIRDLQGAAGEDVDPFTDVSTHLPRVADLQASLSFERARPDGRILAIHQLPLPNGGAIRVFRDITEKRKAEAELRQSQKLEALGHLTAGIAHDFNNILGVITLNLELLENPGDLPPCEIRALLSDAITAAQTAGELVGGLLKFSRQQVLTSAATESAGLVKGALPLLRQALAGKLVLRSEIPATLWAVQVDPAQVQSALLNLAINARDASEPGGELSITAANMTVCTDAGAAQPADLAAGDYVRITVTDQGHGMEPAVLARAFEPFFSTKAAGMGSGLGLSMVFGSMRQIGGTVTVDSRLGAGTTVCLYLPRAAHAPSRKTIRVDPVPLASPKPRSRILLVEDNPSLRKTTRRLLMMLGYDVVVAGNAAGALEVWAHDTRFDLIFSDMQMPGAMNGMQLVQTLRAGTPGLRVLLTTGFADKAGTAAGRADAAIPLIRKPYLSNDLQARLREVLATP